MDLRPTERETAEKKRRLKNHVYSKHFAFRSFLMCDAVSSCSTAVAFKSRKESKGKVREKAERRRVRPGVNPIKSHRPAAASAAYLATRGSQKMHIFDHLIS